MRCEAECVSLRVGVGVDPLQGHDVIDGFLHSVRMDAEGRLQQLQAASRKQTQAPEEEA